MNPAAREFIPGNPSVSQLTQIIKDIDTVMRAVQNEKPMNPVLTYDTLETLRQMKRQKESQLAVLRSYAGSRRKQKQSRRKQSRSRKQAF